jgi:hypothetical protein
MNKHQQKQSSDNIFVKRIDFYWQFTSIYAVVLLAYLLIRGATSDDAFSSTLLLKDPMSIMLAVFTLAAAIGMIVGIYKKHTIIIGKDFIIFRTRFREKKYQRDDMVSISFSRKKITRFPTAHKLVKIRLKERNRIIRIRPSSFWNEKQLMDSIFELKHRLNL